MSEREPSSQVSDERGGDAQAREQALEYLRVRRRTSRALGAIFVAVGVLLVFNNPRAWGDGTLAYGLCYAAWLVLVVGILVAYRSNGRACEIEGFCRGRHRLTSRQLLKLASGKPAE